jgi:hypothetical protein
VVSLGLHVAIGLFFNSLLAAQRLALHVLSGTALIEKKRDVINPFTVERVR